MKKIGYISGQSMKSQNVTKELLEHVVMEQMHDSLNPDIILVIGGDGELLRAMHKYMHMQIPFYGLNTGTVGFLMNNPEPYNIQKRLETAVLTKLYPLSMIAYGIDGTEYVATAINDVAIFRRSNQSAKFSVKIDDIERLAEVVGDGILVSTPAGSSAYNFSAGGTIIPLDSHALCLTPICPFRPRRWRGAILPHHSVITLDILEPKARPVSVTADFIEYHNISKVVISELKSLPISLLFDINHSLEDRVIKEQFVY